MIPTTEAGNLAEHTLTGSFRMPIQAWRGILSLGLWLLPLDFAIYECTAGSADPANTFTPKVNGVALCSPVVSQGDPDDDADALVAAINAAKANHNYWAIKRTSGVFALYQRRYDADGEAVAFTVTVAGDAAGDVTDFTDEGAISPIEVTDTIPDTYFFYELATLTSGALDLLESGTPRIGKIELTLDKGWKWFHGLFNPASETYARIVRPEVAADAAKALFALSSMANAQTGATGYIIAPAFAGGDAAATGTDLFYI